MRTPPDLPWIARRRWSGPVLCLRCFRRLMSGPEAFAPESATHDGDFAALIGLRVKATGRGANAENIEKVGAGDDGPDDAGLGAGLPDPIGLPDAIAEAAIESKILKRTVGLQLPI